MKIGFVRLGFVPHVILNRNERRRFINFTSNDLAVKL